MKSKPGKGQTGKTPAAAQQRAAAQARPEVWYAAAAAIALAVLLWAYSPVIHAPFVFDDTKQIFALSAGSDSFRAWTNTIVRPLLMATYWLNHHISGDDTASYHVLNLLIHFVSGVLAFLVLRNLASRAGMEERKQTVMAGLGAAVFLLHPAQTESVAYIAGRSESLSGMFALASFAAFLYREEGPITWGRTALVALLAGAATLCKEQAVVLFGVFVLTDLWWGKESGLRRVTANWRLYLPLLLGGIAVVAVLAKMILGIGTGGSAGFGMKEFTWYQYLFTEFRGIWVYISNYLLPVNLNLDWDFAISRDILQHSSILGLAGLLVLAAMAWLYRREFPLAAYGYLLFLLFLAPTSSILPIKDPVADRRIYLPMIGLLMITIDLVSRLKIERKNLIAAGAVLTLIAAAATHARAEVWSDPVSLWSDTAQKSPRKSRVQFQLGFAYFQQQRFDASVAAFERAAALGPPDYDLLVDWALAYDGLHQPEKALEKLRQAAALESTAHVYSQIGKIYAERGDYAQARIAFDKAQSIDANFAPVWAYKGLLSLATNDPAGAIAQFQRALELDPSLQPAREGLMQAQQRLRGAR